MKGITGQYAKEFYVANLRQGDGAVQGSNFFGTRAEADDHAARTVSANKGGECVVYAAVSITKLPTPEVVVVKVDTAASDSK
jgi:hypothetical protein